MGRSSRWRKPFQEELPVPVQTRKLVGDPCFFELGPHLGTGFYVLVREPGCEGGCLAILYYICKTENHVR